ncbi:MAG TPA: rhomboid family intramembrane serine protease, partial [Lacipirellulaceae bacterium]|nr:rhomboid family intramembrane serine protease [Lacipirellulaceae bacterium]
IFICPLFVEVPAVLFLGLWFASQLFQGTVTALNPHLFSPVAFWAHAGGFVAGMALLPAFVEPPANRRSDV